MAILETKKERILAGVVGVLVFLVFIGSCISVSNYNALKDPNTDAETAADHLESSNGWSITTLIISLLALCAGGGYLGYKVYLKYKE